RDRRGRSLPVGRADVPCIWPGELAGVPVVGGGDGHPRAEAPAERRACRRSCPGGAPDVVLLGPDVLCGAAGGGPAEEHVRLGSHAVSAGEPLPGDLFSRFGDRFGLEILDGIGSTEMTHIYISNRRGQAQPGSSGMPVVGYEIRLVDDSGQEVPAGVPGQLRVSGASAATGYWCRSQETRRSFEGEWFRSGDMYVRSQDGRYTYLGRAGDMFKVGGEWVAPAEVEAVLMDHAGVLEAVVVGRPREDGLLEPAAYVVPVRDAELDEVALGQHCSDHLAGFKRPREVVVVDQLPKTATGKIKRSAVREWAHGAPVAVA
ncbi:MAG: AMP-binding protein, partial [Thermoleophilaceae bacterium]|nr:AMP-binding protein [Thermoleophilaceae bacterium]